MLIAPLEIAAAIATSGAQTMGGTASRPRALSPDQEGTFGLPCAGGFGGIPEAFGPLIGRSTMSHYRMTIREETGYVVLDSYGGVLDPVEWQSLEYVDWKSSGDTRFAPLASAQGQIECNGFWHADPPKADKDGIWIPSQVAKAPTLARRAHGVGANVGRCRVIELQPNSYADALYNSHLDDNNRLNP